MAFFRQRNLPREKFIKNQIWVLLKVISLKLHEFCEICAFYSRQLNFQTQNLTHFCQLPPTMNYSCIQKKSHSSLFLVENGLFHMAVTEGKSTATPLSFWLQLTIDQTFQMRYIMSLNSHWF